MIKIIIRALVNLFTNWKADQEAAFNDSFIIDRRQVFLFLARTWEGIPYVYGRNGARDALVDCSGFIVMLFRMLRIWTRKEDYRARDMVDMFTPIYKPKAGALVMYGKPGQPATHVMACLDSKTCIGATGGDSRTTSIAKAKKRDAKVKIIDINYRDDIKCYRWPWGPKEAPPRSPEVLQALINSRINNQ